MCGRFTQNYTWHQVHEFLSVFGAPQNLRARYNIAPGFKSTKAAAVLPQAGKSIPARPQAMYAPLKILI
jgi:putative SOS response-associated peptidase YedK